MYVCDKKNPRRILVGLRCGEVLEAVIGEESKEESKLQKVIDQSIMR